MIKSDNIMRNVVVFLHYGQRSQVRYFIVIRTPVILLCLSVSCEPPGVELVPGAWKI